MADQIIVYAKIGSRRELFQSWERQAKESKRASKGQKRYQQERETIVTLIKFEDLAHQRVEKDENEHAREVERM